MAVRVKMVRPLQTGSWITCQDSSSPRKGRRSSNPAPKRVSGARMRPRPYCQKVWVGSLSDAMVYSSYDRVKPTYR